MTNQILFTQSRSELPVGPVRETTFSQELVSRLNTDKIVYISHDSYYKDLSFMPLEERKKMNFDHPDSLDTDLMIQHLITLKEGKSVDIPVYDFQTFTRTDQVEHITPHRLFWLREY